MAWLSDLEEFCCFVVQKLVKIRLVKLFLIGRY